MTIALASEYGYSWHCEWTQSHKNNSLRLKKATYGIHALEVLRGPLVMLVIFSFLLLACLIFFVHFLRMRKSEREIEPTAAAPSQPNCPGVSCSDHSAGSYLINRPYFPRPREYGRLFSEPTYWPRCSRGQYGEANNQAGIFSASGNKSLIPGKLAHSPPSFYSKSMKRKLRVCP